MRRGRKSRLVQKRNTKKKKKGKETKGKMFALEGTSRSNPHPFPFLPRRRMIFASLLSLEVCFSLFILEKKKGNVACFQTGSKGISERRFMGYSFYLLCSRERSQRTVASEGVINPESPGRCKTGG